MLLFCVHVKLNIHNNKGFTAMNSFEKLPNPSRVRIVDNKVFLSLPHKTKPVCIGWLSNSGDVFNCNKNPKKHFHRLTGSYGFNYEAMRDGKFSLVLVRLTTGHILKTSRNNILTKGQFLEFKKKQFEKQLFLRLSDF